MHKNFQLYVWQCKFYAVLSQHQGIARLCRNVGSEFCWDVIPTSTLVSSGLVLLECSFSDILYQGVSTQNHPHTVHNALYASPVLPNGRRHSCKYCQTIGKLNSQ